MKKLLVVVLVSLSLVGCGSNMFKPNTYDEAALGYRSTVTNGRVETVRKVEIQGKGTPIGSGTGLLLGGAAGYNTIGGGSGKIFGGLLGGMMGLAAAAAIESSVNSRPGIELTVITESNRRFVVVQDDDGTVYLPGDVVRIVDTSGRTRVIK